MEKHLRVIWDDDIAVSVIGGNANPEIIEEYQVYHRIEKNPDAIDSFDAAVEFAEWCLGRGHQVYIYSVETGLREKMLTYAILWLSKKVEKLLPEIVIGRPQINTGIRSRQVNLNL